MIPLIMKKTKKNSIDGVNLPDSRLVELLDRCAISVKDVRTISATKNSIPIFQKVKSKQQTKLLYRLKFFSSVIVPLQPLETLVHLPAKQRARKPSISLPW